MLQNKDLDVAVLDQSNNNNFNLKPFNLAIILTLILTLTQGYVAGQCRCNVEDLVLQHSQETLVASHERRIRTRSARI